MNFTLTESTPASRRSRKTRVALDDYPSPKWTVRRLIDEVPSLRAGGRWLEPSAGDCNIIKAFREYGVDANWTAVEIDKKHCWALESSGADVHFADFRDWARSCGGRRFSLALGNPPYSLALEFVQSALLVAQNVCLLLRVGFLESDERNEWIRANTPDLYILPNRPQFRRDGGSDLCAYAWHWWGARGSRQHEGRVRILASTPLAERKRG